LSHPYIPGYIQYPAIPGDQEDAQATDYYEDDSFDDSGDDYSSRVRQRPQSPKLRHHRQPRASENKRQRW